jgi:hypothetical protein
MDKAKIRNLVDILKESQLYVTLTHEERMSLLFRLVKDYPFLGNSQI